MGQPNLSRETKFSGVNGGKEFSFCSADHKQDFQPYAVDLYSAACDDHTCIRILYCSVYPQLPPVIGAPWDCCGHASGMYFPRPLWFGGCATHATPCSVPEGTLTSECVGKNLNATVLQVTCTMQQSLRFFFYSRV